MDASNPPYLVAKVNCNVDKYLCYKYTDNSGYPDPVMLTFKRKSAVETQQTYDQNEQKQRDWYGSDEAKEHEKEEERRAESAAERELKKKKDKEESKDNEVEKSDEELEKEKMEAERIRLVKLDRKMKKDDINFHVQTYRGGKTSQLLYKTLMKGRSLVSELKDLDHFNNLKRAGCSIAIAFFDIEKKEKAPGFKAFQIAAGQLQDEKLFHVQKMRHFYTFDPEIIKAAGQKPGVIVVYRADVEIESDFEEKEVVYDKNGKFTAGLVRNFLKDATMGLAQIIRPDEKEHIGYPLVLTIFGTNPKPEFEDRVAKAKLAREITKKAAKDLSKKYTVNFAMGDKMQWRDLMSDFKIKSHDKDDDDKFPFMVVLEDEWSKYVMDTDQEFNEKNVYEFLRKHERREIKMYVKSEEDPLNSDDEPLTILTANNFEKYVNGSKDVFIKFYAPWCGHCRKLAPYYQKMADMLHPSKDDLLIAKMDIDQNDLPAGYEVEGIPTLYWIKKGDEPKKYKGSRDPMEIAKFLDENATVRPKTKSIEQLQMAENDLADAMAKAKKMADEAMKKEEDIVEGDAEEIGSKDEL